MGELLLPSASLDIRVVRGRKMEAWELLGQRQKNAPNVRKLGRMGKLWPPAASVDIRDVFGWLMRDGELLEKDRKFP